MQQVNTGGPDSSQSIRPLPSHKWMSLKLLYLDLRQIFDW